MDGIDIVKKFEGCRLKAYPDPATGGTPWTIGFGSTRDKDGKPFKSGDVITQEMADALFTRDFNAEKAIILNDPNMEKLPDQCVDALTSLCYNIKGGFSAFKKSKCYRAILEKNVADLYHNWDWGVSQSGVALGLARRRATELTTFLEKWDLK